jgi:hypothetical protein
VSVGAFSSSRVASSASHPIATATPKSAKDAARTPTQGCVLHANERGG